MARKQPIKVGLRPDQVEWLDDREESISATVRAAVDAHIEDHLND